LSTKPREPFIVRGMHLLTAFEALRAIPVLEALTSGTVDASTLAALGFRDAEAWQKMARVYFGPTRHRKLQAAAREAAGDLSLDSLAVIEKHTRTLLRDAPVTDWELRVELCHLRGTVEEISRAAAARVRAHNRRVKDAEKKAYGKRALRGGKNTNGLGLRTISVTLPERDMTTLLGRLLPTAHTLRGADPQLTYEQAMADALVRHVAGGVGEPTPPPVVTQVVIGLPDYLQILRGDGDDVLLGLTDGTTITGAEWLNRHMQDQHLVGLYHPVEGPVDLYRSERFATFKQRMLLAAATLICPFPGCTTAADQCQVHHLTAWDKGGDTNLREMTMLCKVHNVRNDDDPDRPPKHGRMERAPGGVVHIPPDGGPPRRNIHPIRDLSAMALANA